MRHIEKKRFAFAFTLLWVIGLVIFGTTESKPSILSQILETGKLKVLMRNSPTVWYEGPEGPTGYEYELVAGFANYLGVELEIIEPQHFSEILPMVAQQKVHFAAAGITITPQRKKYVRFSPPIQQISQLLVRHDGTAQPESMANLVGKDLEIVAESSHAERLELLKKGIPGLSWRESYIDNGDGLLHRVAIGNLEFTITDSNLYDLNQRFYPDLKIAFKIGFPEKLGWAFPKDEDPTLYHQAIAYLTSMQRTGEMARIKERFYSPAKRFKPAGLRSFTHLLEERLLTYKPLFQEAAIKYGLDWRLLAAIGYQESHWNPNATSPTGVRGLMMLTNATARYLKVADRLDPKQSIFGGAKYFKEMIDRVPAPVTGPDRAWFAMAGYNMGMGHVYDARRLAKSLGKKHNQWTGGLRDVLPLLTQPKWHKTTRYGYARGHEGLSYVENIRGFYELLIFWDEQYQTANPAPEPEEQLPSDSATTINDDA